VIRVGSHSRTAAPVEVVADLTPDDGTSLCRALRILNTLDVAVIQHDVGIYSGRSGEDLLALLRGLSVPSIVVFHSVSTAPSDHLRRVTQSIVRLSTSIVTTTFAARDHLVHAYGVDPRRIHVIPHGAHPIPCAPVPAARAKPKTILTWGWLSPDKGIEWGIEAMAGLHDLCPFPRYVVAGQTNPSVLARDGETYRLKLSQQVQALGLGANVVLDGKYRNRAALAQLVNSADVVLLPYSTAEPKTSAVLVEAVAALKPVVATRFPHAVELLDKGAGVLVPRRDPRAITAALRSILTHEERAEAMREAARRSASGLLWPSVVEQYLDLIHHVLYAESDDGSRIVNHASYQA
jgi:polysaccharide biosynthesis protein PslF